MQEGLQDYDERQMERMKRADAQKYEPLEVINARRQAQELPLLVPYTPRPEKQRRRRASAK